MVNSRLLSMFVALFAPCAALAGGVNANALKSAWGSPAMSYCQGSNLGKATIGWARETCKGNYAIDDNWPSQCVMIDDMGILLLLARNINEHGARFCVTTIYAEHKKKGNAWTLYAEPAEGSQKCYWLCKPGYGGENCSNTTVEGCDSTPLLRENFNKFGMARDPQVESSIPMFHWNEYVGCGVHKGQEHDMVLAVSDWLASGHGAWARPFVIRARREGWKSKRGGIEAWPAAEPTLLCKNGYTANAAGNDCVPVNETTCALTQTCSNWPSTGFDATTMVMDFRASQGCYQYRCKEAGYAFASSTDKTCTECAVNLRGGASPVDGSCIKCPVGKIFDANSPTSGYCVDTNAYIKTDMQYGKGQTKSSQPDVSKQCWTFAEPEQYTVCVRTGGNVTESTSTSAPTESGNAARAARVPVRR